MEEDEQVTASPVEPVEPVDLVVEPAIAPVSVITKAPDFQIPVMKRRDLDTATNDKVRSLSVMLRAVIDRSYSILSHLIYRVKEEKIYKEWGFDHFKDYVRAELDFCVRKADYLVDIHKVLTLKLGVSRETLDQIGWTKAKELTGVIDETNKDELLDDAQDMTVDELKLKVKSLKLGVSPSEVPHQIRFSLAEDQVDNLDHALSLAADICKKAGKPSQSKNHLIDMIALHFAASHAEEAEDASLGTFIKALERRFGGKLIFFKSEELARTVLEALDESEAVEEAASEPVGKEPGTETKVDG